MVDGVKFCQSCGGKLSSRPVERVERPYCVECGRVVFLDPKVAAAVLAAVDGKLVMVRRANKPAMGRWSDPSGYVDRGETVEEAAVREFREETGLEAALDGLVGLYSRQGSPVVLAVYAARVVGGSMRPGSDVKEVALMPPHQLPQLPFPHDGRILADWMAHCANRDAQSPREPVGAPETGHPLDQTRPRAP